jgi:hypothetical protein
VLSEDSGGFWIYAILWNSHTIEKMGRALYKKCEKDNLDIKKMNLAESDLEAE